MDLQRLNDLSCRCGRAHTVSVDRVLIQPGALQCVPGLLERYGIHRPYIICDSNTRAAAAQALCSRLDQGGIPFREFCFEAKNLEPDESAVGRAIMEFDPDCDGVVAVGSGVINDIGKLVSHRTGRPYIVVATAPSMDGYASATSSMVRHGLKVSLDSCTPMAIVADLDVLCRAPERLLQAGIGDMVAKYISICEWRIASVVVGEYYCEAIAQLIRDALQTCIEAAPGLKARDPRAVQAVMEGLVLAGLAMGMAGVSRPASGIEHYVSHIWDMRGIEFGTPVHLHGIQCGVATLLSLELYESILALEPDYQKGCAYAEGFDLPAWNRQLEEFLGRGAQSMMAAERREQKYRVEQHHRRLARIVAQWDDLCKIMREELPKADDVRKALDSVGAPIEYGQLGISAETVRTTITMTKDIRDKYIASRLLWDMGELESVVQHLPGAAAPGGEVD